MELEEMSYLLAKSTDPETFANFVIDGENNLEVVFFSFGITYVAHEDSSPFHTLSNITKDPFIKIVLGLVAVEDVV